MTIKTRNLFNFIVIVAVIWVAITFMIELSLGWPQSGSAWIRRMIAWALYFWVFRTLWKAIQKRAASGSRTADARAAVPKPSQ